jgi:uncharacterized membrane protein YidH (DUF202 family)
MFNTIAVGVQLFILGSLSIFYTLLELNDTNFFSRLKLEFFESLGFTVNGLAQTINYLVLAKSMPSYPTEEVCFGVSIILCGVLGIILFLTRISDQSWIFTSPLFYFSIAYYQLSLPGLTQFEYWLGYGMLIAGVLKIMSFMHPQAGALYGCFLIMLGIGIGGSFYGAIEYYAQQKYTTQNIVSAVIGIGTICVIIVVCLALPCRRCCKRQHDKHPEVESTPLANESDTETESDDEEVDEELKDIEKATQAKTEKDE